MVYYRRTYQNNIDSPDRFEQEKIDKDRLMEETLQVKAIGLFTADGVYWANDTIVSEVIESYNYYIIKYIHKKVWVLLRYSTVYKIEFEPYDDNPIYNNDIETI